MNADDFNHRQSKVVIPNNIPIEFSAPVPGVDIRKEPKMRDRHPSPTAMEGSEPVPGKWPEPDPDRVMDRNIYPGEGVVFAEKESDYSVDNSVDNSVVR